VLVFVLTSILAFVLAGVFVLVFGLGLAFVFALVCVSVFVFGFAVVFTGFSLVFSGLGVSLGGCQFGTALLNCFFEIFIALPQRGQRAL
jgi:hypothetical protein